MGDNWAQWVSGDSWRCSYCTFYARSPVFFFPPGTYKFVMDNMQYDMYVSAVTATESREIGWKDFGKSIGEYKLTVTLEVETADYYIITASTAVSATAPGAGIEVDSFAGDKTAWDNVVPQGWAEPNTTLAVTRDDLTCDFDDFSNPDCSTVITVTNTGPVAANVTFADSTGAFTFSQPAAVIPANGGQLTATATADPASLAPGAFYDGQLLLLTEETINCKRAGAAFRSGEGYKCEHLLANVTIGAAATGELAALPPAAAWNCSIGPSQTFCSNIELSLHNPGNATLGWKAVFDSQNIHVNPSRGWIAPRTTTVATVDVQEARFPPGAHLETVELLTSALRHHCAGALLGNTSGPISENFTCSAQTVPVGVEVELTSGLVAYPGVLPIDLPLDKTRDASVSAMFVEVDNGVPYRVDTDPACGAALTVTSGEQGTLVRLVPGRVDFRLEGLSAVGAFHFNGSATTCVANITRLDNEERRLPVTFNVTTRPGPPSAGSTLGVSPAAPMAGTATEVTLQGVDRLGSLCDRLWEDVRARFVAVDAGGEETALGTGLPLTGEEAGGFHLELSELPLPPGTYQLRGYLDVGEGADAATTQVDQGLTLEVVPIECPKTGESAARTGTVCECDGGFGGAANSPEGCASCPQGSYKEGSGNFACISCPGGSTTRQTQATSPTECLCPKGSFLSGDGVSVGCTPCVAALGEGASTADMGATSADECQCEPIYFRDEAGRCVPCPPGARCDGGFAATMELETGFWRSSRDSSRLHECQAPRGVPLCAGGAIGEEGGFDAGGSFRPSDALCRPGHQGALCWECKAGHGKRLGVCEKCSGKGGAVGQSVAFVVLGTFLFLAAILGLTSQNLARIIQENEHLAETAAALEADPKAAARRPPDVNTNLTVGVIKVLVTWLQLASLANSVRVPKGPEMSELLKWEDLGNVSPWSFASFNCAVRMGFYPRFYATTLVPVACAPLGALITLLFTRVGGVPQMAPPLPAGGRFHHDRRAPPLPFVHHGEQRDDERVQVPAAGRGPGGVGGGPFGRVRDVRAPDRGGGGHRCRPAPHRGRAPAGLRVHVAQPGQPTHRSHARSLRLLLPELSPGGVLVRVLQPRAQGRHRRYGGVAAGQNRAAGVLRKPCGPCVPHHAHLPQALPLVPAQPAREPRPLHFKRHALVLHLLVRHAAVGEDRAWVGAGPVVGHHPAQPGFPLAVRGGRRGGRAVPQAWGRREAREGSPGAAGLGRYGAGAARPPGRAGGPRGGLRPVPGVRGGAGGRGRGRRPPGPGRAQATDDGRGRGVGTGCMVLVGGGGTQEQRGQPAVPGDGRGGGGGGGTASAPAPRRRGGRAGHLGRRPPREQRRQPALRLARLLFPPEPR